MERGVGVIPLACSGRTHAVVIDGRVLRIRCRDARCRDCKEIRDRGLKAKVFHCWDLQNVANAWTELEAPDERQKET